MPKIIVEIEWNAPVVDDWLNADNIAVALNSYFDHSACATKIVVKEAERKRQIAEAQAEIKRLGALLAFSGVVY